MYKNDTLYRTILDAMPQPLLVVDDDVRIVELNKAALGLMNGTRQEVLRLRGGEAMHCIHSTDAPGGCGRGPHCRECVIRNSVREAMTGKPVHRQRTKAELVADGTVKEIDLLVTSTPVHILGGDHVLLILEDVSEIIRLRSLIPMCAHCRRIRDDEQYWQSVEAYFKTEYNALVTHGLCQECMKKLYPEHSDAVIRKMNSRKNTGDVS